MEEIIYRHCGKGLGFANKPDANYGYKVWSLSQNLSDGNIIDSTTLTNIVNRNYDHKNTSSEKKEQLGEVYVYLYMIGRNKESLLMNYRYISGNISHVGSGSPATQTFLGEMIDYPCKFFGSSSFDMFKIINNKSDAYYYSETPNFLEPKELIANNNFIFEKIGDFISNYERKQKLANVVKFLIENINKNKTLFIKATSEEILYWIAAISYAFPPQLARKLSFSTRFNANFKEFYNIIGTDENDNYNFADAKSIQASQCEWLDNLPDVELSGYFELITQFDEKHRKFVQEFCKNNDPNSFDMEKSYNQDYQTWYNYQTTEGVKKEFNINESSPEKQTKQIKNLVENHGSAYFRWDDICDYCIINLERYVNLNTLEKMKACAELAMLIRSEISKICVHEKKEYTPVIERTIHNIAKRILTLDIKWASTEEFLDLFGFDEGVKKNILGPLGEDLNNLVYEKRYYENPQRTKETLQIYKNFIVYLNKKIGANITVQTLKDNSKLNIFEALRTTFEFSPDIAINIINIFDDKTVNIDGKNWFIDCALELPEIDSNLCKFVLHYIGDNFDWNYIFASIKDKKWFDDFACEVWNKYDTNGRKELWQKLSGNFKIGNHDKFFDNWRKLSFILNDSINERIDIMRIICNENYSWIEAFACTILQGCGKRDDRELLWNASKSYFNNEKFGNEKGKDFFAKWFNISVRSSIDEYIFVVINFCDSKCLSPKIKKEMLVEIDNSLQPKNYDENQYKLAEIIQKTPFKSFCNNSMEIVKTEEKKNEDANIKIESENYLNTIVAYWINVFADGKKKLTLKNLKKILKFNTIKDKGKKAKLESLFDDDRLNKILDIVISDNIEYNIISNFEQILNRDELFYVILKITEKRKQFFVYDNIIWIVEFFKNMQFENKNSVNIYLFEFIKANKNNQIIIEKTGESSFKNFIEYFIEYLFMASKQDKQSEKDKKFFNDLKNVLLDLFENCKEKKIKIKDTVHKINACSDNNLKKYIYKTFPDLFYLGVKIIDQQYNKEKDKDKKNNIYKIIIPISIIILLAVILIIFIKILNIFNNNNIEKATFEQESETENVTQPTSELYKEESQNENINIYNEKIIRNNNDYTEHTDNIELQNEENREVQIDNNEYKSESFIFNYIIQEGESLSMIAEKFNTNTTIIEQLNDNIVDIDKIFAGQELRILIPFKYIAQEGETLSTIAEMFNIPIESLKQFNIEIIDSEIEIASQELQILPLEFPIN